jgi:hypothetical protein
VCIERIGGAGSVSLRTASFGCADCARGAV